MAGHPGERIAGDWAALLLNKQEQSQQVSQRQFAYSGLEIVIRL